jgi:peptidylprolyl isomerase
MLYKITAPILFLGIFFALTHTVSADTAYTYKATDDGKDGPVGITLTSPSAGESFNKSDPNDPVLISWNVYNAPKNSKVEIELEAISLSPGGMSGGGIWSNAVVPGDSQGTYRWDINSVGRDDAGVYRVRVKVRECHPNGCFINTEYPGKEVAVATYAISGWQNLTIIKKPVSPTQAKSKVPTCLNNGNQEYPEGARATVLSEGNGYSTAVADGYFLCVKGKWEKKVSVVDTPAATVLFQKSTAKKIQSKNGDSGEFQIKFFVKAKGDNVFINSSSDDSVYEYVKGAQPFVTHSFSLKSSAKKVGSYYLVPNGSSKSFTLTAKVVPQTSGDYSIYMSKVKYERGAVGGAVEYAQIATKDVEKFSTKSVTLKGADVLVANKDEKSTLEKTNKNNPVAVMTTNKGVIEIELFQDTMPITTANFKKLATQGFYNGTKFHRVISEFMIQGGDPTSKTTDTSKYGTGGPGYTIPDEFVTGKYLSNVRGTIAMANAGPSTGGSQFFINLVDNHTLDWNVPDPNNSQHPVFGRVIKGMDVVDAIGKIKTNPRSVPVEDIVVSTVVIK